MFHEVPETPAGIKCLLLPGLASTTTQTWSGSLCPKFVSPSPFLLLTGTTELSTGKPSSQTVLQYLGLDAGCTRRHCSLSLPVPLPPHRSGTAQEALHPNSETQVQILVLPLFSGEFPGLASQCSHCLICTWVVGVLTYWPCVVHHRDTPSSCSVG